MTKDTKGRLCVGFVLDESGSMGSVFDATITGFNEYVDGLRKQDGKTSMTVMKFSSHTGGPNYRPLCENTSIELVPKLDEANYKPNGNTPLFDAIGHTVKEIEQWLDAQKKDWPVLFVIQTDGWENASHEYSREAIFGMIEAKEKQGWKFIYLGADQDAFAAENFARGMGMSAGSTMTYASATTGSTYSALTSTSGSLRANSGQSSAELTAQLKKEHEEEEKKKRGGDVTKPNF